jgi:1-acyl-sn-glycerol-3-phosphate acyltransferase
MSHARFRLISNFILQPIARTESFGTENIPLSGGCILASNHLSALDLPLIVKYVPRNDSSFFAAKTHKKIFWFRWLIDSVDGIWIDRSRADLNALRNARKILRKGYMFGIMPEGTRSRTGALIHGKLGAAYLVSSAKVPVLPVGVTGTENGLDQLRRLRRLHLTIRFGEPFTPPPLDPRDRDRSLGENTDEIMCRIAALLPPKYRGVYSDHPRLHELLGK